MSGRVATTRKIADQLRAFSAEEREAIAREALKGARMQSSGQNVQEGHVTATCTNCETWVTQVDAWWDFELNDPIGGWVCPGCGHHNDIRRRAT